MDELDLTQKQLAELMGCSQQYVSKVLKGQEKTFSRNHVKN